MKNQYKQKFQKSVGFEADSGEHSTPTPTVDFDFAAVDGVDTIALEHKPTRDETEALLKEKGLPDLERQILLMRTFDRASVRRIADATGKKKSWIADKLKSLPSELAAAKVRRAPKESHLRLPLMLAQLRERMRQPCPYSPKLGEDFRQFWKGTLAEKLMAWLRVCPEAMLREPELANALADLLEASQRGQCANRVPGLLPVGSPRKIAAVARKALAILTAARIGTGLDITLARPQSAIHWLCWRIEILRKQWNYAEAPGSKEIRLKKLRELHPDELKDFSKKETLALLTKADPLTAACRLAEKATGVSWKVFHKIHTGIFPKPTA